MPSDRPSDRGRAVPSGRLSRLAAIKGLAGVVAGRVLREGAARLAQGQRSRLSDLVLTPRDVTQATSPESISWPSRCARGWTFRRSSGVVRLRP